MPIGGQHLLKRATFLTSEENDALLPASARDQTVTKGGMIIMRSTFTPSARRVFQTVFFPRQRKLYNKLPNDSSLWKQ